jgi:hypothetical protein
MLYHLITLNPNKDITLHVSVNNPAMVCIKQYVFFPRWLKLGGISFYTIASVSKQKNSSWVSMKTISTLKHAHPRTRSGCGCGDDESCYCVGTVMLAPRYLFFESTVV